jgi:hypothetical protein
MKDHGTIIGDVCYEYFDEAGRKKHRKIGSLFYYRNHSGGIPSAQFRWDMLPASAWEKNADVYFIANFMPSEKVPEAPYICGSIYVPSDERGDRTQIGHVGTRQRPDNDDTQYYMQLFGVPIRELSKAATKGLRRTVGEMLDQNGCYTTNEIRVMMKIADESGKKHSLYCGIELEG